MTLPQTTHTQTHARTHTHTHTHTRARTRAHILNRILTPSPRWVGTVCELEMLTVFLSYNIIETETVIRRTVNQQQQQQQLLLAANYFLHSHRPTEVQHSSSTQSSFMYTAAVISCCYRLQLLNIIIHWLRVLKLLVSSMLYTYTCVCAEIDCAHCTLVCTHNIDYWIIIIN